MNPRQRRLFADLHHMQELAARDDRVSFQADGDPPEAYNVLLNRVGLARQASGELTLRHVHRFVVYLHLDYPRRPPQISWLTPIFHPNILSPDRNGGVCIGMWSASESLSDLVMRVATMVEYGSFNADDALDLEAAAWVRSNRVKPGAPLESLARRSTMSVDDDEIVVLARQRSA
jgi:ubiquitin-protein ligase